MLLARVAAELRRDGELSKRLFPVRFMEDSQEIFNLADFWLDTLFHLEGESAKHDPALARELRETHIALTARWREETLEKHAQAAVLDAADRLGKKLVLMVENLQALWRNVDDDFGWKLRGVLQSEPQIMLVASATSRFKGLDDAEQPFFEMFRIVGLEPLGTDECGRLWQVVSGNEVSGREIRPLEILTGGSPRLLAIVSGFGRHLSLRRLMEELVRLIDDHTEYFRGHLEILGKTERRVYLAAIDLWQPSSTGEISVRARMDVRTVSTMLGRLVERGAVIAEANGRKRMYRVAERLYSIYYKLRREREEAAVIANLIRFMTVFYSKDELVGMSGKLIAEAVRWPVIREGLERAVTDVSRTTGSTGMPDSFVALLLNKKAAAHLEAGDFEAAMAAHDEVIARFGVSNVPDVQARVAWALSEKADSQEQLGNLEEAIATCDELIARFSACSTPELQSWVAYALSRRGDMQGECKEFAKAIAAYDQVVGRFGESDVPELQLAVASTLFRKGDLQGRSNEPAAAILSYDEIVRRFGGSDSPWLQIPIAWSLDRKGDTEKGRGDLVAAMAAYEEVVARFGGSQVPELQVRVAWALAEKGDIQRRLGNFEAAMATYEEVVACSEDDDASDLQMLAARALFNKADLQSQSGDFSEAIAELGEIVARFGASDTSRLQYPVALALSQMGMSQIETGDAEGALHTCEDLEGRLQSLANEEKAEFTWRAMCVRALALMHLQEEPEAMQSFRSAYAAFTPDNPTVMGEMLEVVPDLIAAGCTSQGLVEILVSDRVKSDTLRPLIVALRLHAGGAVRQPVEVLEVAADIRQRIEAVTSPG